jgi:hypothetical protein
LTSIASSITSRSAVTNRFDVPAARHVVEKRSARRPKTPLR